MSEEHFRAQQTLLLRGRDLAALQADLKKHTKGEQSFLDEHELAHATKLPRLIIHPLRSTYQWWSDFLLIWVLYTAFVGPFEFAFLPNSQGLALTISDTTADFLFVCDLVITFFVAFYDKETAQLIIDHKRIAIKYLRSFFLFDLLSCIPFHLAIRGHSQGTPVHLVFRILGLLRLIRLRRLSRVFSKLEKNLRINYFWTRTFKFILVTLLAGHFAGCFFYFLATTYPSSSASDTWIGQSDPQFRQEALYHRYITSLYFAVVTITTVGYGDYSPTSVREMTFAIFYIIFSMGLTAYVIGNITALIQKSSARTLQYRQDLKDLHTYCVYNNLPTKLRREMVEFMQLKFRISEKRRDVLDTFPRPIRARVAKLLHRSYLEGANLFKGCSPEMLEQMEADVEVEYFMPDDILITQKDIHPQLYILTAGVVELSVRELAETRVIGICKPGMSVGDVALLCNIPQPFTCKAVHLCRVLIVKRQIFKELLQSFPSDAQQMANNLLKRMRGGEDNHLHLLADKVAALVVKKEEELVLQVCAAAAHGDLRLLQQLMQSGIDPNVGDFDGRRPLHVAAAMGYDDCVRFLISSGADVNVKDKFNCSPLSEALRLCQQSTAELLLEHGADVTPRVASYDLCTAIADGNVRRVDMLLRFGVDPNCGDFDGKTALELAVSLGNEDIVRLLLDHGAQSDVDPPRFTETRDGEIVSSLDQLEQLRDVGKSSADPLRDTLDRSAHFERDRPTNEVKYERAEQTNDRSAQTGEANVDGRREALHGDEQASHTFPKSNTGQVLGETNFGNIGKQGPESLLAHPMPQRGTEHAEALASSLGIREYNQASEEKDGGSTRQEPIRLPDNKRTNSRLSNRTPPLYLHRTPLSSPHPSLRGSEKELPVRYKDNEEGALAESVPLVQAAHRARSEAQDSQATSSTGHQQKSSVMSWQRLKEPKRITVHPLGEREGTFGGGLVVALGSSLSDVLSIAESEYGYVATRLLDERGAEVRDVRLLRDGDNVFLAPPGASASQVSLRAASLESRLGNLQELLTALQSELKGSKV